MPSTFATLPEPRSEARLAALRGAFSAAAVTVPHALGLGLIAFAPLGGQLSVGALALWSAALPTAVLAMLARRPGVVHAPTTVVALLFAAVLAIVADAQQELGLGPHAVLAVAGATTALGFTFQWIFGLLKLASLARFLPISVTQGFAAGVGLTMILGQFTNGFGAGGWRWDGNVMRHGLAAFAVVVVGRLVQRRWPNVPGLLPAVLLVSLLLLASGLAPLFAPAVHSSEFAWPALPDWTAVPWSRVLRAHGLQLVSLALLMAIVNGLDVVVFDQELALEHGLHNDANAVLRRESVAGILCGLCGLIPASTSASRSRIALAQAGPAPLVGPFHAVMLLVVAATGHWWLPYVPMACLSGALLVAGLMQVPANLWSRVYARAAPATWSQSWLVALVFAASGGVGALAAGLLVATFVLLHSSANTALRRALLDGELRSRRLRHAASDSWLAGRMQGIAVFQLQGVMSFGVAAHLCEQMLGMLRPEHRRVIVDSSRVAAWDATALARLGALARDLAREHRQLAACGLDARSAGSIGPAVTVFADLDRALEWAEDLLLEEMPRQQPTLSPAAGPLGELADGLGDDGRQALEALLRHQEVEPQAQVFRAGDADSDLVVVQRGRITLCTAWPPASGLRLASVGHGMAFGEMAFLNGQPRTAWAGADAAGAGLVRLARADFDAWAGAHPADALVFIGNLAQIGTRRLAATTRQLRSVLE